MCHKHDRISLGLRAIVHVCNITWRCKKVAFIYCSLLRITYGDEWMSGKSTIAESFHARPLPPLLSSPHLATSDLPSLSSRFVTIFREYYFHACVNV